ncbi:MAG: type I-E CRISPR-associated protein Cas5/CasD [Candidatus Sericytochromatia bacterium]|nr:type I-E CRISPR-associated protein Cas5/CasD [Candidatus Sericytochromatia bacterium]
MQEFLSMDIYGSIQSWGDIAVGSSRSSYTYPSKSAIMGLIAAAFGISRDETKLHQELEQSLKLAIKIFNSGTFIRDFHTVQSPPKGNYASRQQEFAAMKVEQEKGKPIDTSPLSEREYLCDAYFGICLWESKKPTFTLKQVQEALLKPVFTLYLGRKSCPIGLPLNPTLGSFTNLKSALESISPSSLIDSLLGYTNNSKTLIYWEKDTEISSGLDAQFELTRYDRLLNRNRWQFGNRVEFQGYLESTNEGENSQNVL